MPAGGALDRQTHADVETAATLVVPVGSVEQHGPHLPLTTDSVIARAVCERIMHGLPSSRLGPCVEYGASGEHEGFPGTVSIGRDALQMLLIELCRSATRWADRVVLVSGHGGNVPSLAAATRLLRSEGRNVSWTTCAEPGWDAHAGRAETSLMLALEPDRVRLDQVECGVLGDLAGLWPTLRRDGVAAVSPNGVLGDPRGATAQEGRRLLDLLTSRVLAQIEAARSGTDGALERPTVAVPS